MSKQFQNPIEKIVERGKFYTPNTQIHDRLLSLMDDKIINYIINNVSKSQTSKHRNDYNRS